jgi:hypothetical protein
MGGRGWTRCGGEGNSGKGRGEAMRITRPSSALSAQRSGSATARLPPIPGQDSRRRLTMSANTFVRRGLRVLVVTR